MSVRIPRVVWNQGGADRNLTRGQYTTLFDQYWTAKKEQIARITGQVAAPDLYMFQTGGRMNQTENYSVILDQIDAIREHNGILVGPMWQAHTDNTDHMGMPMHLRMYETAAWAIIENEAGRAWNLLPPETVTRVGNTITIPISVRSDETLTTVPGKYAAYGGDPANLGMTAVGGGSITSASVSGSSIIVGVSGVVTAVRHAFQSTGIDYRAFLDGDGEGYPAPRSLIRTTLTRTRAVGGVSIVCERWLPSFEVTIT